MTAALPDSPTDTKQIFAQLREARIAYSRVNDKMHVRRALISRVIDSNLVGNGTGTNVIAPFDESSMIIRYMGGEVSEAVQYYAGRLSTNQPTFTVTPITTKPKITDIMDKTAGEQERLDAELWAEACSVGGGRGEQQRTAAAMMIGGVAYLLTLPRDLTYGLPDRTYYDDVTDEEIALLERDGKLSPSKILHPKTGQMVYAESGDVWAARRKEAMKAQKVSGKGLFMVRAFPRDMVLCEKDAEGLKWWAAIETVSASAFGAGSAWAMKAAQNDREYTGDPEKYGIMLNDRGAVIGGLSLGGPTGYGQRSGATSFTFVTYVNREELVYLVTGPDDAEGGKELWRGKHRCTVQGRPACPVDEIPCIRGDIDLPEHEFMTPLDPLFAVVPILNQDFTMLSNVNVWNATPRMVGENKSGSPMRGDDGELVNVKSSTVPGLNPSQIAFYPGPVTQLTIPTADLIRSIELKLQRLDLLMPSPVTKGIAGASAPAWQVHQLRQEAQQNLREPGDNLAAGICGSILKMHGWLRQLDMDVLFWAAPGHRKDARSTRGLIEFDPKNLTDSITVKLELDTLEDMITVDQVAQAKLKDGLITREDYFNIIGEQDAHQKVIDSYAQVGLDSVLFGTPLQGLLGIIAQAAQGRALRQLQVLLPQWSPNAARATAQDMAMRAKAQVAQQAQIGPAGAPGGVPKSAAGTGDLSLADAAGQAVPGAGLAPTLPDQLGMTA